MTTTTAPSSAPADASASPLPDVIRVTVPAQYDGEEWFTFNADKTAAEVASVLRDRYPHLASVTLSDDGDWLRVIERLSWDAPVERYRICGVTAAHIDSESSDDDLLHVRLVRLGCDDPGPEAMADDEDDGESAAFAGALHLTLRPPTKPREEPKAVSTEAPTEIMEEDLEAIDAALAHAARETVAADEAALAAASVPPKRSRKSPSEENKTPPKGRSAEATKTSTSAPLPSQQRTDYRKDTTPGSLAVSVAREPLRAALRTVVTAAASGRLIAPITANVLIEARADDPAGGLFLTCTDWSQRLSVAVVATVQADGAYTVPAKLLSQLVDTFTAPDVTLRQDGEVLRVTSGKSRGHLKGIDAAEFPGDRQDSGDTCTLPAVVLRRALTLTEWAAARDEARPVLKCVGLAAAGGTLVAKAADGNTLSYWSVPLAGVPEFTALLPRDAAENMARLLAAREGDVTLSLLPSAAQPNVLRLAVGGETPATLSTRTSEGQPPDPLRVVPKTHTLAITVQRAALLGAVRQAGVVAARTPSRNGWRPSVLVNLRAEPGAEGTGSSDGTLHVWSTNASIGEQRMEIAASVTSEGGEPLHWRVDGTYLVEMLGALDEALDGEPAEVDDGTVTLRLSTALNPVRIGCAALPEWIGVVMPIYGGGE
jgi:DNA polymerase III sliding clamp (beta) subunit (PCNA family)